MNDVQVSELRRWAAGLADDTRPELKAAAKAIQLLCDDVLAARSQLLEERLIREALEAQAEAGDSDVAPHLLDRVRSLLGPRSSRHES